MPFALSVSQNLTQVQTLLLFGRRQSAMATITLSMDRRHS